MKNYYDLEGDGGSGILEQVEAKIGLAEKNLDSVRSILAIGSGKGGVGKSSLTAALGAAIASRGHQVAILDADLNGPSQARLNGLGVIPLIPGESGLALPRSPGGVGVVSMGSVLPEHRALELESVAVGDSHTWRATQELTLLRDLLATVEWGDLDLLLIDLPPGVERTAQYAEVLGSRVALLLVTIPSDLARGVVSRSVSALDGISNRVLGYVENMNGYFCDACGETRPLFPEARSVEIALPLLGSVPFDPRLAERLDRGLPAVHDGEAGAGSHIGLLAARLEEMLGLVDKPASQTRELPLEEATP